VHEDLPFSGALEPEPVVGEAERLELRIGQRRIQDQAARCLCINGKKCVHSLDFTLDSSLAFDRQDLVQDLLHDLSRGALGADAHQIGRDFEGVQLAL